LAGAFVLFAALPAAQVNVTFQVDMNPYITSCQHLPDVHTVTVPGSFNGWNTSANQIFDADEDGIYAGTFQFTPGDNLAYKFYSSGPTVGWEDNTGDRMYTVTADPDQILPVVVFADPDPIPQPCGGVPTNYEIVFEADMRVQLATGGFNPGTQIVSVAGAITDWANGAVQMTELSGEPGVYGVLIQADSVTAPGQTPYKFIIREIADPSIITWESGPDRLVTLTGGEPDADMDGYREAFAPRRFFDDVTFDDILNAPAEVFFEADLRAAYYVIADGGTIPIDASGGGPGLGTITGLFINGPFAGAADENTGNIDDWATWGPSGLGAIPERRLVDNGTNGDLVAGDSIFTLEYNYPTGTARRLVGKMGVDGYDNEAAFGNDQNIFIEPGTQRIRYNFGCMRAANRTYEDNNGPGSALYEPYLFIDNTANPPTCTVVRSGGVDTANEPGTGPLSGVSMGTPAPNPVSSATRFSFTLEEAQAVTIRVYDVTGRAVATLVEGQVAAGTHQVTFEAGSLPSGVYVYRLITAEGALTGRLTVAR
jgi:hypothetical protein